MAKIAIEKNRQPQARLLAKGDGWAVSDVACACGPHDRPFEEQHSGVSIAIVIAGTFQYRSSGGCELMTPGSVLLGNAGQYFSCGHEYGAGDRCISFSYTPEYFERLASDAGSTRISFKALRIPPIRELSPLVAQASAALAEMHTMTCEELCVKVASQAVQLESGIIPHRTGVSASSLERVMQVVRMIESNAEGCHDLASLAGGGSQPTSFSPYV